MLKIGFVRLSGKEKGFTLSRLRQGHRFLYQNSLLGLLVCVCVRSHRKRGRRKLDDQILNTKKAAYGRYKRIRKMIDERREYSTVKNRSLRNALHLS